MARLFLALCFSGLVASKGRGQEVILPSGPPPEVAMASAATEDNRVMVAISLPRFVPETREKIVVREGKKETVRYTVMRPVVTTSKFTADGKRLVAFRKSGAEIDPADLAKLLAKQVPVALFRLRDPQQPAAPDPYYVQVLRDDVVILVMRQQSRD